MKTYYFSEDGKIKYGDKYSHLSKVEIELPDAEVRDGYNSNPAYNPKTGKGYWEYIEIKLTQEEQIEKLKQEDLNNKEAIAELYTMSMGL